MLLYVNNSIFTNTRRPHMLVVHRLCAYKDAIKPSLSRCQNFFWKCLYVCFLAQTPCGDEVSDLLFNKTMMKN